MHSHGTCIPHRVGVVFPFIFELARREEIVGIAENLHLLHTLVSALANGLPATFVMVLIFLDILGQRVERPVWRVECQVHEERLFAAGISVDVCNGGVGQSHRAVIVAWHFAHWLVAVDKTEWVEVVHHAVYCAVAVLETAVNGIVVLWCKLLVVHLMSQPLALVVAQRSFGHMPFSHPSSAVAGILEHFGYCYAVVGHCAAISRLMLVECHTSHSGLVLIKAGEHRSPSGAAAAGVVEMSETDAVFGQTVEVGCLHIAAIAANVGIAEVVGKNHQNVWTRVGTLLSHRLGTSECKQSRAHSNVKFCWCHD